MTGNHPCEKSHDAEVFRRLEIMAEAISDGVNLISAAAYAANYAFEAHTGVFGSPRLEARPSSDQVGTSSVPVLKVRPGFPPQEILHLMTEAYDILGHARLALVIDAAGFQRTHSLVMTRQPSSIPKELHESVLARRG